jgi:hypothetical protein
MRCYIMLHHCTIMVSIGKQSSPLVILYSKEKNVTTSAEGPGRLPRVLRAKL